MKHFSTGSVKCNETRRILLDDEDGSNELSYWNGVEYLQSFYEPLVATLHHFERDDPILAQVYPNLIELQDHIRQSCQGKSFAQDIQDAFEDRWTFLVNEAILLGVSKYNQLNKKN